MRRIYLVSIFILVLAAMSIPAASAQGLDLNKYCSDKGWGRATLVGSTAYSWKCESGSTLRDMSIEEACHMQYGNNYHAKYRNYNDPNSWYCEAESSPAPAPVQQQTTQNSGSNSGNSEQQPGSDSRYHGSMSPLSGNYIKVNESGLRIRTGPSTGNTALGHVVRGEYYQLIERNGSWGKINTSRGQGWVHLGYTTVYGTPSSSDNPHYGEGCFNGVFYGGAGTDHNYVEFHVDFMAHNWWVESPVWAFPIDLWSYPDSSGVAQAGIHWTDWNPPYPPDVYRICGSN